MPTGTLAGQHPVGLPNQLPQTRCRDHNFNAGLQASIGEPHIRHDSVEGGVAPTKSIKVILELFVPGVAAP
ncbi:MAG: hypothetical protein QG599_3163 [Pseudomonadota bacterium]|nr:hypothetical protein [Pseudomonadota bacterium]